MREIILGRLGMDARQLSQDMPTVLARRIYALRLRASADFRCPAQAASLSGVRRVGLCWLSPVMTLPGGTKLVVEVFTFLGWCVFICWRN